jgi:catalase
MRCIPTRIASIAALLLSAPAAAAAQAKSLPEQIADVMVQLNGGIHPGFRFAHAKGLVLTGTFTPAPSARTVSDANPNASPRGMAIRCSLPKGAFTDIVANSHNGFFVGTGDDFLAFLKAIAATTPSSAHPNPIEQFLGAHPRAAKVIKDSQALPRSFATLAYFGNNAFVFVDSAGTKRVRRYQILPAAGIAHLDSAAAAKAGANYLFEELRRRIARGPIRYTLAVQLANPGDPTNDGSVVWPDDRKRVTLGTISLTAIAPDNETLQRSLAFSPIYLTDGIHLCDDPFPGLRAAVYALSVQLRGQAAPKTN